MGNELSIMNARIDLDKFKLGNELEDEVDVFGAKSGEFTGADGTIYTYTFNYGLNIHKKSDVIKID